MNSTEVNLSNKTLTHHSWIDIKCLTTTSHLSIHRKAAVTISKSQVRHSSLVSLTVKKGSTMPTFSQTNITRLNLSKLTISNRTDSKLAINKTSLTKWTFNLSQTLPSIPHNHTIIKCKPKATMLTMTHSFMMKTSLTPKHTNTL